MPLHLRASTARTRVNIEESGMQCGVTAWYGYNCGHKQQPGAGVERPGKWTKEHGWGIDDGVWDTLKWWMKWDDLEFYKREKKQEHVHEYKAGALPDLAKYHKRAGVEEKVVVIV